VKKDADVRQRLEDEANEITEEQRKEMQDKKMTEQGPGFALKSLYGPNPSGEQKDKVQNVTKMLSSSVFGLLWQGTKSDITTTLTHVCRKVLQDHSVSEETRGRRSQALLLLGQVRPHWQRRPLQRHTLT
jgi:hypothetical protein